MDCSFVLANCAIYTQWGVVQEGYLLIQDGKIAKFGPLAELPEIDQTIPVIHLDRSYKVIPGMIDLHIHGAAGADTMDATQEALEIMGRNLPKEGTTSFLATTMTQEVDCIEKALANVAQYVETNTQEAKAEIIGIHLEGPFLSPKRAGAQPLHTIMEPSVRVFKKWQQLAKGQIRLVTLAPEREGGLALTQHLKETGVVASIGHSDATYDEVVKGIQNGITHATHLFNGMRGLHHRDPGVAGAALLHPEVTTEIIADGVHVRGEMIDLSFRLKGKEGIVLVTDAMRAKCLGEGEYTLGGQAVTVRDGKATLTDGTLAGSILKMKDAALNMMSFTGCSLEAVIFMTAVNPAKELGIFDRKGSITVSKDADLVILNEQNDVMMTYCRGKLAFSREEGIV
jgi:N-acetylglucosamine-6-phosphate deacetylase